MSIISTAGNYGGKIADNTQGVKQFYISPTSSSIATWIFQRINGSSSVVQTPANPKTSVVIKNDLVVTGSLYHASDIRLKKHITDIDPRERDAVLTLNPIHFNFKDEDSGGHYGFIAQEVEKVFPSMVEDAHCGYKTVNYEEMIPLMLAKLQHLQTQVDGLYANAKQ